MYVHEHIRYAEALAGTGNAEAFVRALRQAIPVGYRDIVPCGDLRQANCYYSSSDVHFSSRYEADERYMDVINGKMTLRGGWRVYSSGPGIFIGIVISRLMGLRIENDKVVIDPVMPKSLHGLSISLEFLDHPVTFVYRVSEGEYSPKHITVNGQSVLFSREENKYREGGASIPLDELIARLNEEENIVEVTL